MGITNTFIEVKDGNIQKALKQYKEATAKYGIKERLMEKKYYTKPSELKRVAKQKAIYKQSHKKN